MRCVARRRRRCFRGKRGDLSWTRGAALGRAGWSVNLIGRTAELPSCSASCYLSPFLFLGSGYQLHLLLRAPWVLIGLHGWR